MARDFRKLKVFGLADELVADVYVASRRFPPEERIGLQAEMRRAAVAVPSNIIIGCERSSDSEYVHYSGVALSNASEARYLLRLANRLGYLADETCGEIEQRYGRLVGGLQKLITATRDNGSRGDGRSPRTAALSSKTSEEGRAFEEKRSSPSNRRRAGY